MYCPKCGEKLYDKYQKYCHNCSSEIDLSSNSQPKNEVSELFDRIED